MTTKAVTPETSEIAEGRWKDLFKLAAWSSFLNIAVVAFAVIAFFIWPYEPGFASTQDIFLMLQTNRIGGLIAIDTLLVVGVLLTVIPLIALYAALKHVNESYALVALVIGLLAVAAMLSARPVLEMVRLSDLYTATTTDAERSAYLAAGTALLPVFDGTAWAISTLLTAVSGLITSVLILRSRVFSRTTAYIGIFSNTIGVGFFIPVLGPILLFGVTLLGIVFMGMTGWRFWQMANGTGRPEYGRTAAAGQGLKVDGLDG